MASSSIWGSTQAYEALQVGNGDDAVRQGGKRAQPILEVEGGAPVRIEGAEQHPLRPAKHHRRQGGVSLNQPRVGVEFFAFAVHQ